MIRFSIHYKFFPRSLFVLAHFLLTLFLLLKEVEKLQFLKGTEYIHLKIAFFLWHGSFLDVWNCLGHFLSLSRFGVRRNQLKLCQNFYTMLGCYVVLFYFMSCYSLNLRQNSKESTFSHLLQMILSLLFSGLLTIFKHDDLTICHYTFYYSIDDNKSSPFPKRSMHRILFSRSYQIYIRDTIVFLSALLIIACTR